MCHELASQGPMIGAFDELPFDEDTVTLEPNSRVYVYSDGCCEINMTNNQMWEFRTLSNSWRSHCVTAKPPSTAW